MLIKCYTRKIGGIISYNSYSVYAFGNILIWHLLNIGGFYSHYHVMFLSLHTLQISRLLIIFYLGAPKSNSVRETTRNFIDDLKQRITKGCNNISPATLKVFRNEFLKQLYYCQNVEGKQSFWVTLHEFWNILPF